MAAGKWIGDVIKSIWDAMTDANTARSAAKDYVHARKQRDIAKTARDKADTAFKTNRDLEAKYLADMNQQDDYIKNYVDSADLDQLYRGLMASKSKIERRRYLDRMVKQLGAPLNLTGTADENAIALAKWFDPSWSPVTKDTSKQAKEALKHLFVDPIASKNFRTLDEIRNPFRQRANALKADAQNELNILRKNANYQQQSKIFNTANSNYNTANTALKGYSDTFKKANANRKAHEEAWKTAAQLGIPLASVEVAAAPFLNRYLFNKSGKQALEQTPDNFAPTYQDPLYYHFGSYYTPKNNEWEGAADNTIPIAQNVAALARSTPSVQADANSPAVTNDESPLDYIPDPAPMQTVQNTAASVPTTKSKTVIPDGLYPNSIKGTREWLLAQHMADYRKQSARNALPPGMSPAEGVQRGIIPYEALAYF
jgi:hypothetical protein